MLPAESNSSKAKELGEVKFIFKISNVRRSNGITPTSYPGGIGFESRLGDELS